MNPAELRMKAEDWDMREYFLKTLRQTPFIWCQAIKKKGKPYFVIKIKADAPDYFARAVFDLGQEFGKHGFKLY